MSRSIYVRTVPAVRREYATNNNAHYFLDEAPPPTMAVRRKNREQPPQRLGEFRLPTSRVLLIVCCFVTLLRFFFEERIISSISIVECKPGVMEHVDKRKMLSSSPALDIVHTAYNQTYAALQSCPADAHLQKCLNEAFRLNEKSGLYPWWFRNLLRDTKSPQSDIFGHWHRLYSTSPAISMCTLEKVGSTQWRKA